MLVICYIINNYSQYSFSVLFHWSFQFLPSPTSCLHSHSYPAYIPVGPSSLHSPITNISFTPVLFFYIINGLWLNAKKKKKWILHYSSYLNSQQYLLYLFMTCSSLNRRDTTLLEFLQFSQSFIANFFY